MELINDEMIPIESIELFKILVPDREAYELVKIFDGMDETESHTTVADAIVTQISICTYVKG